MPHLFCLMRKDRRRIENSTSQIMRLAASLHPDPPLSKFRCAGQKDLFEPLGRWAGLDIVSDLRDEWKQLLKRQEGRQVDNMKARPLPGWSTVISRPPKAPPRISTKSERAQPR
jgi:hypothetical protein